MSTDDTQTPTHRGRVEAMSQRVRTLQAFRLMVAASTSLGHDESDLNVVEILGQMLAEVTALMPDEEQAGAWRRAVLTDVARAHASADDLSRQNPGAWAKRIGGPGVADLTLPSTSTLSAAEAVIPPAEALVVDARSILAKAEIAAAVEGRRALNLTEAAIHLKFAIHDEMKRAPASVRQRMAAVSGPERTVA